jgi:hypothetical protein
VRSAQSLEGQGLIQFLHPIMMNGLSRYEPDQTSDASNDVANWNAKKARKLSSLHGLAWPVVGAPLWSISVLLVCTCVGIHCMVDHQADKAKTANQL